MKTMYIECNMGASSDMILGALLELVDDKDKIISKLNAIGLVGVNVKEYRTQNCGVEGTSIGTKINGYEEAPGHASPYVPHKIVRLHTIRDTINASGAPMQAKKQAIEIYEMIAKAKGEFQGKDKEKVFFHEVGRVDAICEILGVCIAMNDLAPQRVVVSAICTGKGETVAQRGKMEVPTPLTKQLLSGVSTYEGRIESELCTPTGSALIRYFATEFGDEPEMNIKKTGIGMGKKVFDIPNCVRIYWGTSLGTSEPKKADSNVVSFDAPSENTVSELSANIDDMTPEMIAYAQDILFTNGALEVYTTPISMKKNRSAVKLSCICDSASVQKFAALILKHTTTRGVREALFRRYTLESDTTERITEYGKVRVKTSLGYGIQKQKIEYDDLARIAQATNRPIKEISDELTKLLDLE